MRGVKDPTLTEICVCGRSKDRRAQRCQTCRTVTVQIGARFGEWTILADLGNRDGQHLVRVRCDCGLEHERRYSHLTSGKSTSCHGSATAAFKHGHTAGPRTATNRKSPEHTAWSSMKARCSNPKHPSYPDYGGRGITVCQRWQESFEAFFADMGPRPSAKHSIDRINNDGHYEPGNCRWTTIDVQNTNRRPYRRAAEVRC